MDKTNDFSKVMLCLLVSKLNILLQRVGYGLATGIIFCFSGVNAKESFVSLVRKITGVSHELHGSRLPKASNSDNVCISYRNAMTSEGVYKYMTIPDYLPTLAVSGLYPEMLKEYKNIINLEALYISSFMAEELIQELDACVEFIAENVSEVCNCMREVRTLDIGDAEKCRSPLAIALYATGSVYRRYLLAAEKESFSSDELLRIIDEIVIDDLTDDIEVSAPVRRCLYDYVDNHGIIIGPIDCSEVALWDAVKEKSAILFDDENYYVPESILNASTLDLQESISVRTIKEALCSKGILVTDRVDGNYTIRKKVAFGTPYAGRERFLVLKQAYFDSPEAATLRERSEF